MFYSLVVCTVPLLCCAGTGTVHLQYCVCVCTPGTHLCNLSFLFQPGRSDRPPRSWCRGAGRLTCTAVKTDTVPSFTWTGSSSRQDQRWPWSPRPCPTIRLFLPPLGGRASTQPTRSHPGTDPSPWTAWSRATPGFICVWFAATVMQKRPPAAQKQQPVTSHSASEQNPTLHLCSSEQWKCLVLVQSEPDRGSILVIFLVFLSHPLQQRAAKVLTQHWSTLVSLRSSHSPDTRVQWSSGARPNPTGLGLHRCLMSAAIGPRPSQRPVKEINDEY